MPSTGAGAPSSGKRQSALRPSTVTGQATAVGPSHASALPPSRRQSSRSELSAGQRYRCRSGCEVARRATAGRRRPRATRARRAARPPRRCRGTRSGCRRATRPACGRRPRAPRPRAARRRRRRSRGCACGASQVAVGIGVARERDLRAVGRPASRRLPTGRPPRTRRARAPGRAGATHRCAWRSTMPEPSSRQSTRRSTRARGGVPSTSGPTAKRGSGAGAVSSSRRPSGESANASTPCASEVSRSLAPPATGTRCTWRSRRNSTCSPSGVNAGAPSSAPSRQRARAPAARTRPRRCASGRRSARPCGACRRRACRRARAPDRRARPGCGSGARPPSTSSGRILRAWP